MNINVISIGKLHTSWANICLSEYAKRLSHDYQLKLIEIPTIRRTKNMTKQQVVTAEGQKILAMLPPHNLVIVLDERGKQWTTKHLAQKLSLWHQEQQNVSLLIGGPDGLAASCLNKATFVWSLSLLTLPHQLVRVIVAEQIYRAWSILKNHPYHRN